MRAPLWRFREGSCIGMWAVSLLAVAWAPMCNRCSPASLAHLRAPAITMQEKPIKSDDQFDYFRRPKEVALTLAKPLGAVLEECAPSGVRVGELQEGGSASATGLLKKGDRLRTIMGEDVSKASFDAVRAAARLQRAAVILAERAALPQVMDQLVSAPDDVELKVMRFVIVRKPKAAAPTLTIDGEAGAAERGVVMRTAIQSRGVELYKGLKAKMGQCGGAGQCAHCWVDVKDGAVRAWTPHASRIVVALCVDDDGRAVLDSCGGRRTSHPRRRPRRKKARIGRRRTAWLARRSSMAMWRWRSHRREGRSVPLMENDASGDGP